MALRHVDCLGRYGSIIAGAREFLGFFQSWEVNHVRRECNEAAHKLARLYGL
jgi:hypothetical protein